MASPCSPTAARSPTSAHLRNAPLARGFPLRHPVGFRRLPSRGGLGRSRGSEGDMLAPGRFVRVVGIRVMLGLAVLTIGLVFAPVSSAAPPRIPVVQDWAITPNLTALSFSERTVPTAGPESNFINSDLAFWDDMVVQGHYNG